LIFIDSDKANWSETVQAPEMDITNLSWRIFVFSNYGLFSHWDTGFFGEPFSNSYQRTWWKDIVGWDNYIVYASSEIVIEDGKYTIRVSDPSYKPLENNFWYHHVSLKILNDIKKTWREYATALKDFIFLQPEGTVAELMQSGKYEQVLLLEPENIEAVLSLAGRLAGTKDWSSEGNLKLRAAIQLYRYALNLDPENEIALKGIEICSSASDEAAAQRRQYLSSGTKSLSDRVEEDRQRNIDNLNNSIAMYVSTREEQNSARNVNVNGQSVSDINGNDSNGNSRSSDGHIANNPSWAQRNYNTLARAAEGHYNNLVKAMESDSSSPTQSHESRIRELRRNLQDCQTQMKEFRAEAEKQGVKIGVSYYETVRPR
jgi:hypothetical protein